ncbi:MAG: ORF6N domain-containing protein [Elusimicrobiota bacterium]
MKSLVPVEHIERRIYLIRGHRVMLDADLARVYGVKTKELNKAVKRNPGRFPEDFAFQLVQAEAESLRFQIGTSNDGRGGRRYLPHAFTEQGVAMLSSVLRSERAVLVNVAIMRAFVRIKPKLPTAREWADLSKGVVIFRESLWGRFDELERRIEKHEKEIRSLRKNLPIRFKPRSS